MKKLTLKQQIEKDLNVAVRCVIKHLPFLGEFKITSSSQEGVDYQCNDCFALFKKLDKNMSWVSPFDLAESISKNFKSEFTEINVSKPAFLNFRIKNSQLVKIAKDINKNGKLQLENQEKQTVFFDYGGANIGKELHAGHLRTIIVGEALIRVYNAFGHDTIADTYLGDWGLPLGLIIAQLCENGGIKDGKLWVDITLEMLNDVYPLASKRKNIEPEFKKLAEDITAKLQNFVEPYYSIYKKIREVSVTRIKKNYERMGCTFDLYNGESNAQPYVDNVLGILEKQGLTYIDKDCLMINVAKDGEHIPMPKKNPADKNEPQLYKNPMPPVILQKGNGGDLYATSDIATILYRQRDFSPDKYIYVTDFRQSLHFTQVFRIIKKGNIVAKNIEFVHIGTGAVVGTDGKPFKTRDGGTIRLEEVVDMVKDAVINRGASAESAERIGVSALKFADLSNNVKTDFTFDMEKFTSFEGKTGPYLLYTVARINSILNKAIDLNTCLEEEIVSSTERNILTSIIKLVDSYPIALHTNTLNTIADSIYILAQTFNIFYGQTNILRETDTKKQSHYLGLCKLVKTSIEFALWSLGIDTVETM